MPESTHAELFASIGLEKTDAANLMPELAYRCHIIGGTFSFSLLWDEHGTEYAIDRALTEQEEEALRQEGFIFGLTDRKMN